MSASTGERTSALSVCVNCMVSLILSMEAVIPISIYLSRKDGHRELVSSELGCNWHNILTSICLSSQSWAHEIEQCDYFQPTGFNKK